MDLENSGSCFLFSATGGEGGVCNTFTAVGFALMLDPPCDTEGIGAGV